VKIVPSYIWDTNERKNLAEDKLFKLLEQLDIGEKSIALHSMNLVGDKKQSWYEIDFLVVTQTCIYGIEAKTGYVSAKHGDWRVHKTNYDIAYIKKKSPYIQAKDATLHWRNSWLRKRFPNLVDKLDYVFVAALYMNDPDSISALNSTELPQEAVLGQRDFNLDGLRACLESAKSYHQTRTSLNRGISKEEVEHIVSQMRPTVEQSFPQGLRNFLLEVQEELTAEQYRLVDTLDTFERLIIDGGAGTGKTFVLAHLVRKDVSLGRRVIILVKPILLREKLKTLLEDLPVIVCGANEFEDGLSAQFDTLYVDEGQDLCNELVLESVDSVLVGGLEKSRWRWFGDFQNQRGENVNFSSDVFDVLKSFTGNSAVYNLRRNVRNTPNIVKWLEHICHARMGETVIKGAGPEVTIESEDSLDSIIDNFLQNPTFEGSPDSLSVAIYPEAYEEKFLRSGAKVILDRENVLIRGAEEFKGLEAEVVIVWVPNDISEIELKDFLYKSVSRARALCQIITQDRKSLFEKIKKCIGQL
jgi:hypothetical protein